MGGLPSRFDFQRLPIRPAALEANTDSVDPHCLSSNARAVALRQLSAFQPFSLSFPPFQRDQILLRKIQGIRSGLLNLGFLAFRVSTVS